MNPNCSARPSHSIPAPVLALLFAFAASLVAAFEASAAPKPHQIIVSFTTGSAFGAVAPVRCLGTFDVDCEFLEQPDGEYPGSNIRNFQFQVGTVF